MWTAFAIVAGSAAEPVDWGLALAESIHKQDPSYFMSSLFFGSYAMWRGLHHLEDTDDIYNVLMRRRYPPGAGPGIDRPLPPIPIGQDHSIYEDFVSIRTQLYGTHSYYGFRDNGKVSANLAIAVVELADGSYSRFKYRSNKNIDVY